MSNTYEYVNNPYEAPQYPPAAAPVQATTPVTAPATAPPGWVQNPDGSWTQVATAPAPVAPVAPVAAPPAAAGYPTGAPVAPPTGAAAPPVPLPSSTQGGGHDRKQLIELRTQSGEPLEQLNLVMMTGYFHHMRGQDGNPKFTESGNSVRLGFSLGEKQSWTDQQGQAQTKVVWHRCQAWNDFARVLVQVQDGTPVKIWGNLTRYYIRDEQGGITGELVDIKVNKYDFP